MSKTLFSYNNKKSLLHKLPALVKIIFTCVFCFFVFGNFLPNSSLSAEKVQNLKILISSCFAIFLWLISKSGFQAFIKLKFVLILGLVFTLFKGFSLESPYFIDIQLAKEGLLYSYNFFITTFVALLLFETTIKQNKVSNDFSNYHQFFSRNLFNLGRSSSCSKGSKKAKDKIEPKTKSKKSNYTIFKPSFNYASKS